MCTTFGIEHTTFFLSADVSFSKGAFAKTLSRERAPSTGAAIGEH
jgi:hypothetical protein